jgi:hypothetical protein
MRGRPEASIVVDIQPFLEMLHISRAAYHSSAFNVVSCRRLVGSTE